MRKLNSRNDMQIPKAQLESFIELYNKEFGIRLSESEATPKAENLIRFMLLGLEKDVDRNKTNDML